MSSVEEEFERLYKEADAAIERLESTDRFEPYLLRILDFIREHPEHRTYFGDAFLKYLTVENASGPPIEVIEFCLRDLQWEEVEQRLRDALPTLSVRGQQATAGVLEVFDDEWVDDELYPHFAALVPKQVADHELNATTSRERALRLGLGLSPWACLAAGIVFDASGAYLARSAPAVGGIAGALLLLDAMWAYSGSLRALPHERWLVRVSLVALVLASFGAAAGVWWDAGIRY